MYWTVHLTGGPRRVNHAAVLVDSKIFTFGGYCSGEDYVKRRPMDVYILNTDTLRWSAVPVAEKGQQQFEFTPYQRYGHSAVVFDKNIFIWGGRNDRFVSNRLYCFNADSCQWSCPKVSGDIPIARDGHSAVVHEGIMYIFGGYIDEEFEFTQDVYALDLQTLQWSFIETQGEPPSYRDFHTANVINNRMYIFGGRGDGSNRFATNNEVYCQNIIYLDFQNMTWVCPHTTGNPPLGRRSHSAFVYDAYLYIFGGFNSTYDEHYNDIFCYCTQTDVWSQITPNGAPPTKRRRQSCIMKGDKMILFGGSSPLTAFDKSTREMIEASRPYRSLTNNTNDRLDPTFGESNLVDNDDLHILDFNPTLKVLAMVKVIQYKLSTHYLPPDLVWELKAMSINNSIRQPSKTG